MPTPGGGSSGVTTTGVARRSTTARKTTAGSGTTSRRAATPSTCGPPGHAGANASGRPNPARSQSGLQGRWTARRTRASDNASARRISIATVDTLPGPSAAFDAPGHQTRAGGRWAAPAGEYGVQCVDRARLQRRDDVDSRGSLADPGGKCGHSVFLCSFGLCADSFNCTAAVLRGRRAVVNAAKSRSVVYRTSARQRETHDSSV